MSDVYLCRPLSVRRHSLPASVFPCIRAQSKYTERGISRQATCLILMFAALHPRKTTLSWERSLCADHHPNSKKGDTTRQMYLPRRSPHRTTCPRAKLDLRENTQIRGSRSHRLSLVGRLLGHRVLLRGCALETTFRVQKKVRLP